ncbi:hypothetical protein H4F90_14350 [Piscinibacter sp. SJAQ100]|uniref:Uncharacterized protein n=1 Tax=Aquariibacter albus TaxID=2759899 RepID=A0A839HUE7_9BURK|nr:hypothetical protein [Aquariibacter albus]
MSTDPREITRQLLRPKGFPGSPPPPRTHPAKTRRAGSRLSRSILLFCGLCCIAGLAALNGFQRRPETPTLAPEAAHPGRALRPGSQGAQTVTPPDAQPSSGVAVRRMEDLLNDTPDGTWRVARLAEHPAILVIEFPDLLTQGAALNRLAALIEKRGTPRDRVLTPEELALLMQKTGDSAATFYQGHDYAGSSVIRFFAQIARQGLPLNPDEERLRTTLQNAGLLDSRARAASTDEAQAPSQALIAFTAVQADDPATLADEEVDARRRETVLRHELSHGFFFTHKGYQKQVIGFWRDVLNESQRRAFRIFLGDLEYDTSDETLMANETQAFLMHTPDPRVFSGSHLGWPEHHLHDLRAKFRQHVPALQIFSAW